MLAVHVACCPAIAQIERIQESKRERRVNGRKGKAVQNFR
jgi:hypothetical protein